jgi:uncharacterized DUF497 family protein
MVAKFEWDPQKAAKNLRKHAVPFAYAARVFADPHRLDRIDDRNDYDEERRITMGAVEGRVLIVIYTERPPYIRIISARKADKDEEQDYYDSLHS